MRCPVGATICTPLTVHGRSVAGHGGARHHRPPPAAAGRVHGHHACAEGCGDWAAVRGRPLLARGHCTGRGRAGRGSGWHRDQMTRPRKGFAGMQTAVAVMAWIFDAQGYTRHLRSRRCYCTRMGTPARTRVCMGASIHRGRVPSQLTCPAVRRHRRPSAAFVTYCLPGATPTHVLTGRRRFQQHMAPHRPRPRAPLRGVAAIFNLEITGTNANWINRNSKFKFLPRGKISGDRCRKRKEAAGVSPKFV